MTHKIAIVIPCYKVTNHILDVLNEIPDFIHTIYIVDDKCPNNSGKLVAEKCIDKRVKIHYNEKNLGVDGAVKNGYCLAIKDEMDIVVKIDGDGQMDISLLSCFIAPIIEGEADYTKGNRFFHIENMLQLCPKLEL